MYKFTEKVCEETFTKKLLTFSCDFYLFLKAGIIYFYGSFTFYHHRNLKYWEGFFYIFSHVYRATLSFVGIMYFYGSFTFYHYRNFKYWEGCFYVYSHVHRYTYVSAIVYKMPLVFIRIWGHAVRYNGEQYT